MDYPEILQCGKRGGERFTGGSLGTSLASAFRGVPVFKTETTTDAKRRNTSTINTDKIGDLF